MRKLLRRIILWALKTEPKIIDPAEFDKVKN